MSIFKKLFQAPRVDMAPMVNIWSRRQGEIADFERKLDQYTNQYMQSLFGLQQNTWNNFVPNTAAMYGARGIFTDSGAFADTIGREAANLQAQMAPAEAEMRRGNAKWVDDARGGNTATLMGAQHQASMTDLNSQGALNSAWGQMAGMAAGSLIGGPMGGGLASQFFGGYNPTGAARLLQSGVGQTGTIRNGQMVFDGAGAVGTRRSKLGINY